jgi:Protein of unknown function, DUF547
MARIRVLLVKPLRPVEHLSAMTRSILRHLLLSVVLVACSQTVSVKSSAVETVEVDGHQVFSHAAWDAVEKAYVTEDGLVDYPALEAHREGLDKYVSELASASPRSNPELFPTRDDALAYWINAYNALIVRAVVDAYPVKSVLDIEIAHGVFNRLHFPVGGTPMTLDDIEKGTLLKEWSDTPEIHWALTCASMGCPGLDPEAWQAKGIHERLKAEGGKYLNSARGVQLDPATDTVRLTKYFDWYASSFGDKPLVYIAPFLTDERRAQLEAMKDPTVVFMDYDWRLNDKTAPWGKR